MNPARTFIIAIAALLTVGSGPEASLIEASESVKHRATTVDKASAVPQTSVLVTDGDKELQDLGHWALDRFETAALTVPAIQIHMHRSHDECGGHRGTFNPTTNRINVCVAEPLVVLHEIAHAWAHENLTSDQRDAFVAAGGFESWNAPETAWTDRGSERAADVIAWGLSEQTRMVVTSDGPIAQRNAEFRMLTGFDVPFIELAE